MLQEIIIIIINSTFSAKNIIALLFLVSLSFLCGFIYELKKLRIKNISLDCVALKNS